MEAPVSNDQQWVLFSCESAENQKVTKRIDNFTVVSEGRMISSRWWKDFFFTLTCFLLHQNSCRISKRETERARREIKRKKNDCRNTSCTASHVEHELQRPKTEVTWEWPQQFMSSNKVIKVNMKSHFQNAFFGLFLHNPNVWKCNCWNKLDKLFQINVLMRPAKKKIFRHHRVFLESKFISSLEICDKYKIVEHFYLEAIRSICCR